MIIVLGFNDMSTHVGHFVSSPKEREKRDRIVEEMKERDRGERKMNESEETEEIKTFPTPTPPPLPATRIADHAQL